MKCHYSPYVAVLVGLFAMCLTRADIYQEGESLCGCQECNAAVLNRMAGDHNCGDRIIYLMEKEYMEEAEACARVGFLEYATHCGSCDPTTCDGRAETSIPKFYCGCEHCTQEVWDRMVPSCGDRVTYLQDVLRIAPDDACSMVGGTEFPSASDCGLCNPKTCSAATPQESEQLLLNGQDDGFTELALHARTSLYCFPEFEDRTRFLNVWGRYTVETKESETTCGPSNNKFTTNTVSLVDDRNIKLQFKKVGGSWEASEVRIRLPEDQMPFQYGWFSFSIGRVEVIDTNTGGVIDNVLPPSLILGLFTWDDTESFAAKENRNHEVDIELSRWNIPDNADLQFLVQPPGEPQEARFFSGPGEAYQQGHRTFVFEWRPGEIEWYGDHGESHIYSVQSALNAGTPDLVQCLPADLEVRMNLWNLFGTSQPTGMEDHHMVEVVIDDFIFTPSALAHVEEGGVCSKNCQCGTSAVCVQNRCSSHRNLRQANLEELQHKDYGINSATSLRAGVNKLA